MKIEKTLNENYVITLTEEDAEIMNSLMQFISRENTRTELDDRISDEEYNMAEIIHGELDSYTKF